MGLLGSLARRVLLAALVTATVVTGAVRTSQAEDPASARRELTSATDPRVRVAAALWLGHTKPAGARELLEDALGDSHPSVRAAAAAALGSLGDPHALPALEHAVAEERLAAPKGQMERSIAMLRAKQAQGPRYVVQLGSMHNNTRIRGPALEGVLRSAAFSRASAVPGVVIADARAAPRIASERQIPLLILDGSLTGLTQGQTQDEVSVHAAVTFVVRRDATLKASLTGSATAQDGIHILQNQQRVAALQNDAVDGAVQSAMRGADTGLAIAAR
jgi:HEAT repeat protein